LQPPAKEQADLPNTLLLGESISIGYEPVVAKKLSGKANVFRIKGSEDLTVRPKNGLKLDSGSAVEHLGLWLEGHAWKVIHFNCWAKCNARITFTSIRKEIF